MSSQGVSPPSYGAEQVLGDLDAVLDRLAGVRWWQAGNRELAGMVARLHRAGVGRDA